MITNLIYYQHSQYFSIKTLFFIYLLLITTMLFSSLMTLLPSIYLITQPFSIIQIFSPTSLLPSPYFHTWSSTFIQPIIFFLSIIIISLFILLFPLPISTFSIYLSTHSIPYSRNSLEILLTSKILKSFSHKH